MHHAQRLALMSVVFLAFTVGVNSAQGQCVWEDFEGFALGAPVTTAVEGVIFSVEGQSCGGSPILYLRVADDFYGSSFTSQVLAIDGGCPDFSPDFLKMIFEDKQGDVRFNLGPWAGGYQIRAYDAPAGGSPVSIQNITIPGTGFVDVHFPVQITRSARDIRRIEIEAASDSFEAIDDLRFGADSTPPEVQIDEPTNLACISGEITLTGIVCDEDGAYDRDRLEVMRTWPNPQTDWTLVREYVGSPVCESFSLYSWDTTETGVIDGIYVLRVTSQNACGLTATKEVTVRVDNVFDRIELRTPITGDIVGGAVCFDGTASDMACFDHYEVVYRPTSGGSWHAVDTFNPTYLAAITNDPMAVWTDAQGLSDGEYSIAAAGTTTTGKTANQQILVTFDNTAPVAQIATPSPTAFVEGIVDITGTVDDEHLNEWTLHYYDDSTQTWSYIQDDSDGVTNGLLAEWDTTSLTPGHYTLRLRATDRAKVGCGTDTGPHVTEDFRAVAVAVLVFTDGFESGGTTGWTSTGP